jgi:hypothetical protein
MKLHPPVWSHRGWDFKTQGEKVHWVSTGHQTPFRSKFGAQLGLACPFFYWTLSTNHCCCYACWAINVLKPRAFNPESQYFIPLFNKISWLCGQQPGEDEASHEGSTQAQQGMTLRITLVLSSCFQTVSTCSPHPALFLVFFHMFFWPCMFLHQTNQHGSTFFFNYAKEKKQ